jgi:hypothetical protein
MSAHVLVAAADAKSMFGRNKDVEARRNLAVLLHVGEAVARSDGLRSDRVVELMIEKARMLDSAIAQELGGRTEGLVWARNVHARDTRSRDRRMRVEKVILESLNVPNVVGEKTVQLMESVLLLSPEAICRRHVEWGKAR